MNFYFLVNYLFKNVPLCHPSCVYLRRNNVSQNLLISLKAINSQKKLTTVPVPNSSFLNWIHTQKKEVPLTCNDSAGGNHARLLPLQCLLTSSSTKSLSIHPSIYLHFLRWHTDRDFHHVSLLVHEARRRNHPELEEGHQSENVPSLKDISREH